MMFNKELFFSLCEKYNIEFSSTATEPMIKEGKEIRPITEDDINHIFTPCQTYFEYSGDLNNTGVKREYCLEEEYALAC